MFIQTEATRDPARVRFLPGRTVLEGEAREFSDAAAAVASPLAERLFAIPGIAGVVLEADAIIVAQQDQDWAHLKPQVLGAIMEYFMSGAPMLRDTVAGAAPAAGSNSAALVDEIRAALKQVIDPELGYNIVDIGLIYGIDIGGDGTTTVTMTTTTVGCPATDYLMSGAREAASSVPGSGYVEVELTHDPHWTPDNMSPVAKEHFGISDGGAW